jgi:hypothetical protein
MDPARQPVFATVGQEVVHGQRSQRDRGGHREERVLDSWGRLAGASGAAQEAAPWADARILRPVEAVCGRDRDDAGCVLLGTSADRAGAHPAADLAAFREALPEVPEECHRQLKNGSSTNLVKA